MKKFSFKFQKVMDVKESLEKQKMLELTEAETQLQQARGYLEQVVTAQAEYQRRYNSRRKNGTVRAAEVRNYLRYIDKLSGDIENQKRVIDQKTDIKESKRRELLALVKDKKILEKLKEYHLSEYTREARHQEQVFLDEVGSVRSSRREN